jgi:L-threonylcarbamoyladenylate synthase
VSVAVEPIAEAARRLAEGDVVAFPTETVYGLGADATNPRAIARIFALKGRPADHPLIVHIGEPAALADWVAAIPDEARALAERFWPGPLTMILARSPRVPDAVTGAQDTVGIRCPSHPIARSLLAEFARVGSGGVAAPSANKFGHVSPTQARHVREEFGEGLMILEGGACEVGLESTIVDLSRGSAALLRPGAVSRADLESVLGYAPRERDANAPRASGTLAAHYAPRTALVLVSSEGLERLLAQRADAAVLALRKRSSSARIVSWIVAPADAIGYGHDLYANLRALDAAGARLIVVEAPPRNPVWEAVNDRLARAAASDPGVDDEP